jgi:hypothetical protein
MTNPIETSRSSTNREEGGNLPHRPLAALRKELQSKKGVIRLIAVLTPNQSIRSNIPTPSQPEFSQLRLQKTSSFRYSGYINAV